MHRYVPKRIHTKLTTRHKLKLTRILVSGSVILLLASYASWSGLEQDSAPSVSPMYSSMVDSLVERTSSLISDLEFKPTLGATEVTLMCQTVYGEAKGCSREEQMLVAWCICNRVDATGASIEQVVTAPGQFHGYSSEHPVTDEIRSVVVEVLEAWHNGQEALVLPPFSTDPDYLYFYGDGSHNYFRKEW